MKICRGYGVPVDGFAPSTHAPIAFDDAAERGVCPLCKTAMNERYMRDTLTCFSNGLIDVGGIFNRLSNAGLFMPIPDNMREHPLLSMKLTK